MEAKDERRLLRLAAQLTTVKLLIVDELGYVPLSRTGAEPPVRDAQASDMNAVPPSSPPTWLFEEWTSIFASELFIKASCSTD